MEHHEYLDPLNEYHLCALSYVYIPRINTAIKEFKDSWNNHPIRTANHKSPTLYSWVVAHSQQEAFDQLTTHMELIRMVLKMRIIYRAWLFLKALCVLLKVIKAAY